MKQLILLWLLVTLPVHVNANVVYCPAFVICSKDNQSCFDAEHFHFYHYEVLASGKYKFYNAYEDHGGYYCVYSLGMYDQYRVYFNPDKGYHPDRNLLGTGWDMGNECVPYKNPNRCPFTNDK